MRFLFTCGGTAGHNINPALGVAGRIRELMPDAEILFIGAVGHMESELVPREGYPIRVIKVRNLSRSLRWDGIRHNAGAAVDLAASYKESKQIIREFCPDVAVGTGGYVCYPVLRAASALGVPTAVHESNALPGLTTKLLEKRVNRIMVGFEDSREHYRHPEKVVVTGTPVRGAFRRVDPAEAKRELGRPADKPLVLSVWGSLGADYMNLVMTDFIQILCRQPAFGLIHATGRRGYAPKLERLRAECAVDWESRGIEVREYIYDMPRVMAAADLVLCRSGASTSASWRLWESPPFWCPRPTSRETIRRRTPGSWRGPGRPGCCWRTSSRRKAYWGWFRSSSGITKTDVDGKGERGAAYPKRRDRIVELILDLTQ
jgi:UDP-N-acetylglucosamine--N-acetylmuramyl-(pentapeptide) pyrophosphoryl-undecaprenol N-acetylglucosamine transferase